MTNREIYNKYRDELIEKRKAGRIIRELGEEYGIPKGSLIQFFEKDGIIIPPKYKTQEYINEVINLYNQGYCYHQIGKMVGSNHKIVKRTLIEQGVTLRTPSENHRKWKLNEHYFDNINTPNKAYILGLLYADGYNSLLKSSVRISLQEGDKDILEKIRKEIRCEKPLDYLDFKGEVRSNGYTCQNMWKLEFFGKHICETLDAIGMHQNKSLILKYPKVITEDLHSHFIRGYFDGDGSISFKIGNSITTGITITSTEDFCISVQTILSKVLNEEIGKIIDASCHNGVTKVLNINRQKQIKAFCDWIYKDADLYLERKYNKYLEFSQYYLNKNINNLTKSNDFSK